MIIVRLVCFVAIVLAAGCFSVDEPGECVSDDQCGAGNACTRIGECVAASSLSSTLVNWTVNGVMPTPADPSPCAGIAELEVIFDDHTSRTSTGYSPVTCSLGRVYYDKMPPRFDTVSVVAYDNAGRRLDWASASLSVGENIVTLDLRP